jgi:membrane protein
MSRFKLLKIISKYISAYRYRKFVDFLKHYIGKLLHRIDEHHLFLSGGGIAFSLLLSLIPFFLLVFAILGNILSQGLIESQIIKVIDTIIPYPEYATYTKKVILSRIPEVIEYKTLAGYLGAFGLLFTSTWLFSSMRTSLNKIFGVSEEKSAFIGLLRDFGMVLLLIVFVLLSTIVFPSIR